MARRLILLTLVGSLLAGCSQGMPNGQLSTARQHTNAAVATAPVVTLIPGYAGPAPSVTLRAVPVSAAVGQISQEAASAMLVADAGLDALELLADQGSGYTVQGWFSDLKDKIKTVITRWKLKREIKAALKHNNEKAFELHEGEIDTIRKNRTAPVTKVTTTADGQEIVSTWNSTNKGSFRVETRRAIDTDGVTQTLSVSLSGANDKGVIINLVRVRTLMGENGAYQVVTRETRTFKDKRKQVSEWTKVVNADSTETIDGWINHPAGNRTEITGTRDAKGKVRLEVSKIAPMHNPDPTLIEDGATTPAV